MKSRGSGENLSPFFCATKAIPHNMPRLEKGFEWGFRQSKSWQAENLLDYINHFRYSYSVWLI
jgi:hypothetical protein